MKEPKVGQTVGGRFGGRMGEGEEDVMMMEAGAS